MTDMREKRMALAGKRKQEEGLDAVIFATGANFQYLLDWNEFYWQRTCMNNIAGQSSSLTVPDALLYLAADGSYKECLTPFSAQRAPKDEKEIEILRGMAKFTDDAAQYCIDNLHEGVSSWQAEQYLMDYGFQNGCIDFSFPPTAGFKTRMTKRAETSHDFSRDDVLVPGTAIAFDVGFMNNGYCSDWGRTVYWGKASDFIKNGYAALQAGQQHMIDSIVPGKTNINELYGFVLEKVTELGYGDYLLYQDLGSLGHQIGIDCHEHPMLNNGVDFVLQPGMVFCSEPKMFFKDECYMRVEDMVLVTETGAESLTKFPRDLFEIGG